MGRKSRLNWQVNISFDEDGKVKYLEEKKVTEHLKEKFKDSEFRKLYKGGRI